MSDLLFTNRRKEFPARVTLVLFATVILFHATVLVGVIFGVDFEEMRIRFAEGDQRPNTFCFVQGVIFQFLALSMIFFWG